jgi:hypothetical protein
VFSSAIDTLHSDAPGHLHYCYWSLSNVPASIPADPRHRQQLHRALRLPRGPIPARGWVSGAPSGAALSALPFGTHVFAQSACISHGVPLHVSNVQECEFQL